MKVINTEYRSIWLNKDGWSVDIIDQTFLPHEFVIRTLQSMEQTAEAILTMRVRAPPDWGHSRLRRGIGDEETSG